MVPRHFISTHRTQLFQVFVIGIIHHFKLRRWKEREMDTHIPLISWVGFYSAMKTISVIGGQTPPGKI